MKKALLLKISLDDISPSIWRSIWIEDHITFQELHYTIQATMGWYNCHLYEFRFEGNMIGIPYEDAPEVQDAGSVVVNKHLNKVGQTLNYIYDFGDGWERSVVVEKVEAVEKTCPPEDCGGPWRYEGLLEIIKDKKHPEYRDMMDWLEDGFDPEGFDLNLVNSRLKQIHELAQLGESMGDMAQQMMSLIGGGNLFGADENGEEIDPNTLHQMLQQMMTQVNPNQEHYEGYSTLEIQSVVYELFEKGCPVQLNKMAEEDYKAIPMLNEVKYLVGIIQRQKKGELKLTQKGNLPVKVVKELYANGGMVDDLVERGIYKVYKEADIRVVNLSRILLELSGICKKRNGKLSLTKKGEKIVEDDHLFLKALLTTFILKFNWGYYDGYDIDDIGQRGVGFTLLLLSKYGKERRLNNFYGEKFVKASTSHGNTSGPIYERLLRCYSLRTFERFLADYGLVEVESDGDFLGGNIHITKTALFDKLISCAEPKIMSDVNVN